MQMRVFPAKTQHVWFSTTITDCWWRNAFLKGCPIFVGVDPFDSVPGAKSKNEKWERAQNCTPFHLLMSHPHSNILCVFFWVKEFLSRHPPQGKRGACVKSLQPLCELALSASLIGSSGSLLMRSSIGHMIEESELRSCVCELFDAP